MKTYKKGVKYATGTINGVECTMVVHYAVIDVVAYFEDCWPEDLIDQAKADAKASGIYNIYQLKEACAETFGVRKSSISDGQKNLFRGTRNPDRVYIVCFGDEPTFGSTFATARWLWSQHVAPENVKILAMYPGMLKEPHFKYDLEFSLDDTGLETLQYEAQRYGAAMGYSFSGPIFKEYADMATMCGPKYARIDSHSYKPYSDITYRNVQKCVSKEELLRFHDYLQVAMEKGLEDYLEPNWVICPECSAIEYTGEDRIEDYKCPYCDTVLAKANVTSEVAYTWQQQIDFAGDHLYKSPITGEFCKGSSKPEDNVYENPYGELPHKEEGCKHSTGMQWDVFVGEDDYEYIQDDYLEEDPEDDDLDEATEE